MPKARGRGNRSRSATGRTEKGTDEASPDRRHTRASFQSPQPKVTVSQIPSASQPESKLVSGTKSPASVRGKPASASPRGGRASRSTQRSDNLAESPGAKGDASRAASKAASRGRSTSRQAAKVDSEEVKEAASGFSTSRSRAESSPAVKQTRGGKSSGGKVASPSFKSSSVDRNTSASPRGGRGRSAKAARGRSVKPSDEHEDSSAADETEQAPSTATRRSRSAKKETITSSASEGAARKSTRQRSSGNEGDSIVETASSSQQKGSDGGGSTRKSRARKRTAAEDKKESDDAGYTAEDEADASAAVNPGEKKVKLSTFHDDVAKETTGEIDGEGMEVDENKTALDVDEELNDFVAVEKEHVPAANSSEVLEVLPKDKDNEAAEELKDFAIVGKTSVPWADSSEVLAALPKDKDSEAAEELKDYAVVSKCGMPLPDSSEVLAAIPKDIPQDGKACFKESRASPTKSIANTSESTVLPETSNTNISSQHFKLYSPQEISAISAGQTESADTISLTSNASVQSLQVAKDQAVDLQINSGAKLGEVVVIESDGSGSILGDDSSRDAVLVVNDENTEAESSKVVDAGCNSGAHNGNGRVDAVLVIEDEGNKDVLLNRTWIDAEDSDAHSNSAGIDVVSYNILAEVHALRDYTAATSEWLGDSASEKVKMLARHDRLMEELNYLSGDVVCLQEVGTDYFKSTLLPAMRQRGYDGVYFPRQQGFVEGEATFYRKSRLVLESYRGVALGKTILSEIDASSLSADLKTSLKSSVDTMAVSLLTRLKVLGTTPINYINVANIHCAWDWLKRPDKQALQVACTMRELLKCGGGVSAGGAQYREGYVICGDFNATPDSPVCQLVQDGHLSEQCLAQLQSIGSVPQPDGQMASVINYWSDGFLYSPAYGMKSSYKMTSGVDPLSTRYHCQDLIQAVDYIWFSSQSLTVTGVLSTAGDLDQLRQGVPNEIYPSDHLSLKARLVFTV